MNDYVVRVDKDPIRSREPFDSNVFLESLFYLVAKLNGHRRDLARRTT